MSIFQEYMLNGFPNGEAGIVHTVIATPPVKLTRRERGCNLNRD